MDAPKSLRRAHFWGTFANLRMSAALSLHFKRPPKNRANDDFTTAFLSVFVFLEISTRESFESARTRAFATARRRFEKKPLWCVQNPPRAIPGAILEGKLQASMFHAGVGSPKRFWSIHKGTEGILKHFVDSALFCPARSRVVEAKNRTEIAPSARRLLAGQKCKIAFALCRERCCARARGLVKGVV